MCCIHHFCDETLDSSASPEVGIQYIGGKDPEMVFLDEQGEVVEVRKCKHNLYY